MTYYFLAKNNDRLGPFSLEELKNQRITDQDFVWTAESNQWQKVTTVKELTGNIDIIKSPPPFVSPQAKKRKFLIWSSILIFVFLSCFFYSLYDEITYLKKEFSIDNITHSLPEDGSSEKTLNLHKFRAEKRYNYNFSNASLFWIAFKTRLGFNVNTHTIILYNNYAECYQIEVYYNNPNQWIKWHFHFYYKGEDVYCDYEYYGFKKTIKMNCKQ